VKTLEINQHAPLLAHKDIFIEAPPQIVWKIHIDIDNWSRWQTAITASKLESPLAVGSAFRWRSGGLNVTSTVQVLEPNRLIGWTGKSLGAQAKHIWKFIPQDNGTMVTTEESMEGWSVGLLKLVMPKFLVNSLDTWLRNLKTQAESNYRAENREV
jgi:uncharacterized protein YndB with AHSA1/START domain